MFAKTSSKISFTVIVFIFSTAFSQTVLAEVETPSTSPYQVVETAGGKLFERISQNQQELAKFPELMRTIIEEELMPVIDYKYAAYKILGTNLRKTTHEQREAFVQSMRQYLVRTYARILNSYTDQEVAYEKAKSTGTKKFISVKTRIIEANKQDINIAFMVRKSTKSNTWKVYDMAVEGISLLMSKKTELNQRIAKRGLDQVTIELASIAK